MLLLTVNIWDLSPTLKRGHQYQCKIKSFTKLFSLTENESAWFSISGSVWNPSFVLILNASNQIYDWVHKIKHFSCNENFYVFRNHMFNTLFDPYNFSQKARRHANKTFSSDSDRFEINCMTRNMSQTYEFQRHKNLFHKGSVLFYGHLVPRFIRHI